MKKKRIDVLLVEQGFAESRSQAQRLVMAGQVRVEDQVVPKPSFLVEAGAKVEVDAGPTYVSRGGEKLAAALTAYPICVKDRICADVGASTGGFTDCLLQHGAARVYAIDVGHGILHWSLRNDSRVVSMERTNARKLKTLPEPVSLVTIDASFISLGLLLPVVQGWLVEEADVIALVKPQFEAGRDSVGKRGVVRDPAVHRHVLDQVMENATSLDLPPQGVLRSPLLGPKGNVEYLMWCRKGGEEADPTILDSLFQNS